MMREPVHSVGIDVGGTKIAAGLFADGQLLGRTEQPTPHGSLAELLAAMADSASAVMEHAGHIGVCTPGLHDPRSGRIVYAGNLRMLRSVDLAAEFGRVTGRKVTVVNDADAAALGEYRLGAGKGWHSCFFVTISTGIGGGFVSPAGLHRGFTGAATEIGHVVTDPDGPVCTCGQKGCLEMLASGTAIARLASERSGRQLSAREVFELARSGDAVACDVTEAAAAALATALAAVTQLFDPEGIVLGGSVALGNADFVEQVRNELAGRVAGRELPAIAVAGLGADAGILGAALLAESEYA